MIQSLRRAIAIALLVALAATGRNASAMSDDQTTACSVILCLSMSAGRPGECSAPLRRYFSLNKPWKRVNFLRLCPRQSGPNIDINALVNSDQQGIEPDVPEPEPTDPDTAEPPPNMTRAQVIAMINELRLRVPFQRLNDAATASWLAYRNCQPEDCEGLLAAYRSAVAAVRPHNIRMRILQSWLRLLP